MLQTLCQNQADSRWRFTQIGIGVRGDGSTYPRTLGSDGCAITCIGNVLGLTPQAVYARLKTVGAIDSGGSLSWVMVPIAYPELSFHFRWSTVNEERNVAYRKMTGAAIDEIKILCFLGQPVIIRTNHPSGFTHFVTVVGEADDGDLIVNDPDGGKQINYKTKYGDISKNLLAYVVLIGKERTYSKRLPTWALERVFSAVPAAVYKAARVADGKDVAVYSKEILGSLINSQ